jgi:hypothetical protein
MVKIEETSFTLVDPEFPEDNRLVDGYTVTWPSGASHNIYVYEMSRPVYWELQDVVIVTGHEEIEIWGENDKLFHMWTR